MGLPSTRNMFLVLLIASFLKIIPLFAVDVNMNSLLEDDVWKQRAEEAWENSLKAYNPDPQIVTSHLNVHSNRALREFKEEAVKLSNSTSRRTLRGNQYEGPCMATNPIDRCWRCQENWADNRKRLADCVLGFARGTTGGKDGEIYVVTDSSDDIMNPKPGTLRHAVIQTQPLWIIFERSMSIRLIQELIVTSDKTIDGRGVQVHIANGAGITLQFVKNVIIHGIHVHDIYQGSGGTIRDSVDHFGIRTMSDGDGISLFGSTNIWIDHVSMWRCYDGLIDAIMGSTAVTISNGHFTDHNEVMLFGASDSHTHDEIMQITVAFNHFGKRLIQRMPRCRFGYFHVVNNDYTHWEMYAIGGSQHPTIVSQGNRFVAPPDIFKKEVTKRDYADKPTWINWDWISEGDLMENEAFFVASGDPDFSKKHEGLYDGVSPASGEEVKMITKFAGALVCKPGVPC